MHGHQQRRGDAPGRLMPAVLAVIAALVVVGMLGCTPVVTGQPVGGTVSATTSGPSPTLVPTSGSGPTVPTSTATSTATGPTNPLPVGSSEHALTIQGRIRMYRTYRPATMAPAAPMVVMVHGGLGSARAAEAAYGWNLIADRAGVVILYPQADGGGWNAGGDCCGLAPQWGLDDAAFIVAAVAQTSQRVSIDPTQVYAAGMSNGGMMAYQLACTTTIFAAIGVVAGTQLGPCINPPPISIIHVHGTDDPIVPITGIAGPDTGLTPILGPPIRDLVNSWRIVDRCGGTIESATGGVVSLTSMCPSNRAVALVTIQGGGHAWPGVPRRGPLDATPYPSGVLPTTSPTAATRATGRPSVPALTPLPNDYPTTERLWAFFAARLPN